LEPPLLPANTTINVSIVHTAHSHTRQLPATRVNGLLSRVFFAPTQLQTALPDTCTHTQTPSIGKAQRCTVHVCHHRTHTTRSHCMHGIATHDRCLHTAITQVFLARPLGTVVRGCAQKSMSTPAAVVVAAADELFFRCVNPKTSRVPHGVYCVPKRGFCFAGGGFASLWASRFQLAHKIPHSHNTQHHAYMASS
jgi:hypothetical protein